MLILAAIVVAIIAIVIVTGLISLVAWAAVCLGGAFLGGYLSMLLVLQLGVHYGFGSKGLVLLGIVLGALAGGFVAHKAWRVLWSIE